MTALAYSYVRFSSTAQEDGDSEPRQIRKFNAYCEKKGLTPAPDTFTDRGKSGFKGEHLGEDGELRRFLRMVESGDVALGSVLVIESFDRLGRLPVGRALSIYTSILEAGITIVTLSDNGGEQVFEPGGGLLAYLIPLVEMHRAYSESRRKADLVSEAFKAKHAEARASLKPMGRACPLWLRLKDDGTGYEEIPERAEVVRRIFDDTINGYGKAVVAKRLNEAGVRNFKFGVYKSEEMQGKGIGWGTSSVDKVLKNRAVFGEYQPHSTQGGGKRRPVGEPIPGYFPAVVSVETFYEAQAAIDGRRNAKVTKQAANFNLWQGLGKCERCGSSMHLVSKGEPPRSGRYLRCGQTRKGICKAKPVRLEHAEEVFRGMLVRLDALSLVKDESANLEKRLKSLEGQLGEELKRLEALRRRVMQFPEDDGFAEMASQKRIEVKALEKELEALKADLAAEQGIGWEEFLKRLDLVSYEGRAKANALMKRLGVLVVIGASGYVITVKGEARFGMDYRDGEAGYLVDSGPSWKVQHFLPVSEVPTIWAGEEAADALKSEGQQAGEY